MGQKVSSRVNRGRASGDSQGSDRGGVSQGGGPSTLTYGPETDLIPNSNLRALDGIPQVDWGGTGSSLGRRTRLEK